MLKESGYAFERVCLHHIKEIKAKLGFLGVLTSVYSWYSKALDRVSDLERSNNKQRDEVAKLKKEAGDQAKELEDSCTEVNS